MEHTQKPRAITRTWQAIVTDREYGVVVARTVYTVTLSRTQDGFTALVDGQPATLEHANNLLAWAHAPTVLHEVLEGQGQVAA